MGNERREQGKTHHIRSGEILAKSGDIRSLLRVLERGYASRVPSDERHGKQVKSETSKEASTFW